MHQVIFDTDIGIDDAMALLFLHYSPEIKMRAIVTGFGNASVENTTRNALFIKEKFGIQAPVYRGASGPLGRSLDQGYPDFVHGTNGLGNIQIPEPEGEAEKKNGAEAIVDIVQQDPKQVSIIAVGRMTNLAEALRLCPELPSLVKDVVVMGGVFGFDGQQGNVSPVAEANITGDPLAADLVFNSGIPVTIVCLDVTHKVIMSDGYFEDLRRNGGKAGDFIHAISRYYLNFHRGITGNYECPVHDSSAVAYLLRPRIFTTKKAVVRVATEGVATGQTIYSDPGTRWAVDAWDREAYCHICTDVDAQVLLDLYSSTLARANDG